MPTFTNSLRLSSYGEQALIPDTPELSQHATCLLPTLGQRANAEGFKKKKREEYIGYFFSGLGLTLL